MFPVGQAERGRFDFAAAAGALPCDRLGNRLPGAWRPPGLKSSSNPADCPSEQSTGLLSRALPPGARHFFARPAFLTCFRVADNPAGGDGKRYADLRDLPVGGNCSGSLGKWPAIASDPEVDPCQRYDLEVATNLRRRPQQIS